MEQGKGIIWRTPTGFRVGQLRLKKAIKNKQIKVTVNGKVIARSYPILSDEIDEVESLNAVAPNFIHSYDSAHLQKTITAASKEGMENFLVIHDSFSTDAEHATRFNHIIREQFVEMYSADNWLDVLHNDVEDQLECPAVTPRQELGDFDINEVLKSKYFFS